MDRRRLTTNGWPYLPPTGLIFKAMMPNLTDTIGISTIVYQSGNAATWQTTAVWGFGYDATTAAINTNLGGNKLFLGTAPIYRTWAEWMDQPWMNLTFLFVGQKGAVAYSTSQAANAARINRYLRYIDVDTDAIPAELALLWNASDVITSRVGPNAAFASAGSTPDGNGGVLGANVPAIHTIDGRKLMWNGPAYTNLFAGAPTAPEIKTLTAQKYCLQVFGAGGSVDAGAYGAAVTGTPLQFTASAGDQTFTPNGSVTGWILTASGGYVFPYVAHGVSVSSCAGTTGLNGTTWPMTGSAAADKLKACFTSGSMTAAVLVRMGAGSAEIPNNTTGNVIAPQSTGSFGTFYKKETTGSATIVAGQDGTTFLLLTQTWERGGFALLIKQVNTAGTQFRIGYRRYSSAMVPIDGAVVWGSWTAYDGSMNPLNTLIASLNLTVPHWTASVQVWQSSALEADILKWVRKYYPEGA